MDPRGNATATELPEQLAGKILTVRERESLRQNLDACAAVASAREDGFIRGLDGSAPVLPKGFNVNRARLNDQMKNVVKVLKEQSPRPLTAKEKDAVAAEAHRIEEELKDKQVMETFTDLRVTSMNDARWLPASEKAKMRSKYEAKIQRWKSCQILLSPDDPDADNLNKLRREKETGT